MILDANERERLSRQAQEMFRQRPTDYRAAVPVLKQAAVLGDAWCMCSLGWCHEFGRGVEQDFEQAFWLYRQAAEKSYAPAQCNLAVLCIVGKGGSAPDSEQGAKWLKKAAAQGFARAQYLLGSMYQEGRGVERDLEKAAKCFDAAARQDYAAAQFSLGVCYERGRGVERSFEAALEQYLKAAQQGHLAAVYNAGYFYEMGLGVEKNAEKAVQFYTWAAEEGDSDAQCNLAWCYDTGTGVPRDSGKAVQLYRKAVEQGHLRAMHNLAWCYRMGQPGADGPDRKERAVELFRRAADQGYMGSLCDLGICYEQGFGVERNLEIALDMYRRSAERGVGKAMNCLGECYWHGVGVEVDLKEALEWFEKGAQAEHPEAQFNAAWFLGEGIAGITDPERAVQWYVKLLAQDLPDRECWVNAANNLGECYRNGRGVPKDLKHAEELYILSGKCGNDMAWFNLGEMYEKEKGDAVSAVAFYRRGIEKCETGGDCALALALLYEKGLGVEKDPTAAVELAQLALKRAENDQQVIDDAKALLKRLNAEKA